MNFDAATRDAFPLNGCVTVAMTVGTTRMSAIVVIVMLLCEIFFIESWTRLSVFDRSKN